MRKERETMTPVGGISVGADKHTMFHIINLKVTGRLGSHSDNTCFLVMFTNGVIFGHSAGLVPVQNLSYPALTFQRFTG